MKMTSFLLDPSSSYTHLIKRHRSSKQLLEFRKLSEAKSQNVHEKLLQRINIYNKLQISTLLQMSTGSAYLHKIIISCIHLPFTHFSIRKRAQLNYCSNAASNSHKIEVNEKAGIFLEEFIQIASHVNHTFGDSVNKYLKQIK